MLREWRLDRHRTPILVQWNCDRLGVELQPAWATAAINGIAHNWKTKRGAMNAKLMCAAGQRLKFINAPTWAAWRFSATCEFKRALLHW